MVDRLTHCVVCAACRHNNLIIAGARHFDSVMRSQMKAAGIDTAIHWEQGFIDQFGNFLTRVQAKKMAEDRGQILEGEGKYADLFSEDLY